MENDFLEQRALFTGMFEQFRLEQAQLKTTVDHHDVVLEEHSVNIKKLTDDVNYLNTSQEGMEEVLSALQKQVEAQESRISFTEQELVQHAGELKLTEEQASNLTNELKELRIDQNGKDQILAKLQEQVNAHEEKLGEFATLLDLNQAEMSAMAKEFASDGFNKEDLNEILPFLGTLKTMINNQHLSEQQKEELMQITGDPYKNSFYEAMQHDLNATYLAAMTVQTDIVQNSKTGKLGTLGTILSTAVGFIPTLGGAVQFLGAVLSSVDKSQQTKMVKMFAQIAASSSDMDNISKDVAKLLVQDNFDKSVLDNNSSNMSEKLANYFLSFMNGLTEVAANRCVANITSALTTTASNAAQSAAQDLSAKAAETVISKPKKFFKLPNFYSKKTATKKDLTVVKGTEIDGAAEVQELSSDAKAKKQGEIHAHIISSIIISKIFKEDIKFTDKNIASKTEEIAISVFTHFNIDKVLIAQLLNHSITRTVEEDTSVVSSISSKAWSIAEEVAEEILTRLKKQVSVTAEFENSFVEAMTSKLEIATSTNEVDLVDSLTSSAKFKKAFTAQAIETLREKLIVDSEIKPTLKIIRSII